MNNLYKTFALIALILVSKQIDAQKKSNSPATVSLYNQSYFGIGAGFDYGGFGLKAEFLPTKYVGFFAGVGYNLVEPAYGAGLSVKVLPAKKVTPVLLAMYGYNAAIRVKGVLSGPDIYRKTYYGVTAGIGADIKYGGNNNKMSLSLLIPFRSAAFHTTYDNLRSGNPDFPRILPIAVSAGVNFSINKRSGK